MALYIREGRSEGTKEEELAFYGPFAGDEIQGLLDGPYADLMADDKANIDAVEMTDDEVMRYYINPPEFWHQQEAQMKS